MNEYKMYGGSICITDIMDALQKGHSAFSKSPKNGKVYANVLEFVREAPDDFGQHISIQLSSIKEKREEEKEKFGKANYIGNCKKLETNQPVTERSVQNVAKAGWDVNVPVRSTDQSNSSGTSYNDIPPSDITEPQDDLPF